jgi:hypothetical protein
MATAPVTFTHSYPVALLCSNSAWFWLRLVCTVNVSLNINNMPATRPWPYKDEMSAVFPRELFAFWKQPCSDPTIVGAGASTTIGWVCNDFFAAVNECASLLSYMHHACLSLYYTGCCKALHTAATESEQYHHSYRCWSFCFYC